eukprot:scaffold22132_cov119-Isochrysis_galbana.AAC.1
MRGSLKALPDHFGCPIDLEGPLVTGAAPASAPGAPSQAATLPFQDYAQLELLARRAAEPALAGGTDVPRFFARSLLLVALTSVRLRDAVRVRFSPHPDEPGAIVYVYGLVSNKRGTPWGPGPPAQQSSRRCDVFSGGRVWLRWPHRVVAPGSASSRRWLRSEPPSSVAMRSKSWRSESPAGVLFASSALVSRSCATRRLWRRTCARVPPN